MCSTNACHDLAQRDFEPNFLGIFIYTSLVWFVISLPIMHIIGDIKQQ